LSTFLASIYDKVGKDRNFAAWGPGGWLRVGLPGSAVADCVRDYPRGPSYSDGTGLTKHPVLGGLDRASRPIAPESVRPLGASKSAQPAITQRIRCEVRRSSREVQRRGCCRQPHNPPKEGFRQGRFSGRKSRADGTGCTTGPGPIRRVPEWGKPV